MNRILLLFISLIACFTASTQNFTGQWKGEFLDKTTAYVGWGGDKCDYVLELDVKGTAVSGSSYTYFSEDGKKYYTICKLEGFIDRKKKYIEVKEIERTKTNVPGNIRNCFQVHRLTYFKQGDTESIEGDWVPAPGQQGDCGHGTTLLTRRSLVNAYPNFNSNVSKAAAEKKAVTKKTTIVTPPVVKAPAKIKPPVVVKKAPVKKEPALTLNRKEQNMDGASINNLQVMPAPKLVTESPSKGITSSKLEKRASNIIKTIEVEQKTVKVDLYDNGEIDGDSVSLFYNGKLLLANKKLSDKPLSLTLNVNDDDNTNELVMYAENLGSIPPNTAIMVVTDGAKRYEVRITSDLQKSGVINFTRKADVAGNPKK